MKEDSSEEVSPKASGPEAVKTKSRAELAAEKKKFFARVRPECEREFEEFEPCSRCGRLSETCQNTCGVIMKHVSRVSGF